MTNLIGVYQKRVLKILMNRSVSKDLMLDTYSNQFRTLRQRGLIGVNKRNKVFITDKGKRVLSQSKTKLRG